jgi:hypothetical protein
MSEELKVEVGPDRVFIKVTEEETAYLRFSVEGNVMVLETTFVPPSGRGEGLGGKLVKRAMAVAEERGLKVRPVCSFAKAYLEKHPEYADKVVC